VRGSGRDASPSARPRESGDPELDSRLRGNERGAVRDACSPSLPAGADNSSPFSRCALASELGFTLYESPSQGLPTHDPEKCSCGFRIRSCGKKEGRRSAERRTTGSAPPQQRKPAGVCGGHHRFLPRTVRDQNGGALAFRRPTAVLRRGFYPSTRLRAALPGITGCKREDPLRHQCSQHLAVRSRAGRSMPRTARIEVTSPIREPHPPHRSVVTGRRPFDGRTRLT